MTTDGIRIAIVDDHPVVRSGLRALFESIEGFEVVGEASSGREAIDLAVEVLPDVVVMDLNMPDVSGVDATRALRDRAPSISVLVLTMADDDESVFAAIRAGARGYLLKEAQPDELVRAVEAVSRGEAMFGPSIAARLIDFFRAGEAAPAREPFPELTQREREVLGLMASGATNPVISRKLGISAKTVRNHVSNVFTKLQVADRAAAIIRARDAGLGDRR